MSVFNAIITVCVGAVMIAGAAITYRHNVAERQLVQQAHKAALADMANARASLPKWDDKNYKGLTYRK
jgi:hypothetical protein